MDLCLTTVLRLLFSFLQDYSKNTYNVAWQKDCWWDKPVVIYGDVNLKRDHPVVAFLAADKHAKSIAIYREGCALITMLYPVLKAVHMR